MIQRLAGAAGVHGEKRESVPSRQNWIIGEGGLLGSNTALHLAPQNRFRSAISWSESSFPQTLETSVRSFGRQLGDHHWRIFWLAGRASARASEFEANHELKAFEFFLNLLSQYLRVDRGTLVLASSAGALYGSSRCNPIESDSEVNPDTPYAHLCISREALARSLTDEGLALTVARLTNVYGYKAIPKPDHGIVMHLLESCRTGKSVKIFDHPGSTRDYIYAPDVGEFLVNLGRKAHAGRAETVLAASGIETSLDMLVRCVAEVVGQAPNLEYVQPAPRPAENSSLSFVPAAPISKTTLRSGVRQIWEQFSEAREEPCQ